jgi:hypothetical protein
MKAKNLFLIVLVLMPFLFMPSFLLGQSIIGALIQTPPTKVETYHTDSLATNQIMIKMKYASADIMNKEDIKATLDGKMITEVALVYSDFARSSTFRQPELNKKRFEALSEIHPQIFTDTIVKWKILTQTSAKSLHKGKELFHGFVVTYENTATSYLSELLSQRNTKLPDSTVLNVFERNPQWKDMLIVSDLTASMTPYTAQVLIWLRLNMNSKRAKHFTFFNDGDAKEWDEKEIGSTGGIYHSKAQKFDQVLETAETTMTNGSGGDLPENDVEAILAGLDACANCGDIVLIADNNSNMRDFALIEKINQPVKVIICGFQDVVNLEYLTLARKTKGSLHTIEKDIMNLLEINEGEVIEIGKFQYIIRNGEFKVLDKM